MLGLLRIDKRSVVMKHLLVILFLVSGVACDDGDTFESDCKVELDTGNSDENDTTRELGCGDPIEKVLDIMECIEQEDVECVTAGYSPDFKKYHNGVDTETVITPDYWEGAFMFVDLSLEINHSAVLDDSVVSLRYVETIAFTDGDSFLQYEHAIVTIDDECRILIWDQYGDNREQLAIEEKVEDILSGGA